MSIRKDVKEMAKLLGMVKENRWSHRGWTGSSHMKKVFVWNFENSLEAKLNRKANLDHMLRIEKKVDLLLAHLGLEFREAIEECTTLPDRLTRIQKEEKEEGDTPNRIGASRAKGANRIKKQ